MCEIELHRDFYDMFAWRVGDDRTINLGAIEGDGFNTLLLTVRMDGDLVISLAEFTLNGVVRSRLWQTRIDADTVVVGLDAEDELRNSVPHPSGSTCEP